MFLGRRILEGLAAEAEPPLLFPEDDYSSWKCLEFVELPPLDPRTYYCHYLTRSEVLIDLVISKFGI